MGTYKEGFNLKRVIAIIVVVTVLGYGVWNARSLITGPSIDIWSPNALETSQNLLVIKGRAKNITYLTLNERPIFINKEGDFEDKLLLSPGFNTIRLYGKDRFKQETTEELRVYYKQTQ